MKKLTLEEAKELLLAMDAFGKEITGEFNAAVIDWVVNHENTFTPELVKRMATCQYYFDLPYQTQAIEFALSRLISEVEDYEPVLTEEYPFWAIDRDGEAYYYQEQPFRSRYELGSWIPSTDSYMLDWDFDENKFKHMWENGKSASSLRTLQ